MKTRKSINTFNKGLIKNMHVIKGGNSTIGGDVKMNTEVRQGGVVNK